MTTEEEFITLDDAYEMSNIDGTRLPMYDIREKQDFLIGRMHIDKEQTN